MRAALLAGPLKFTPVDRPEGKRYLERFRSAHDSFFYGFARSDRIGRPSFADYTIAYVDVMQLWCPEKMTYVLFAIHIDEKLIEYES